MRRVIDPTFLYAPQRPPTGVGRPRSSHRWLRQLPSALLVFACLVPLFTWWRGHQLVWGLDGSFPISIADVNRYFHLGSAAYAAPDARKLSFLLPWGVVLRAWEAAGLPWNAGTAQRIYEIGMLLASAFGARLLIREWLPEVGEAAVTVGALFYAYNAYALTTVWTSQSYLIVHYSLLPALVLLFTWAIVRGSPLQWSAAGVGWALLMSPAYITTPLVVTDFGVLAFVGMWARFARGVPSGRVAVAGTWILAAWALCSLYWIVPLLQNFGVTFQQGIASISGVQSAALFRLNSAPLLSALRLGGYWGLTAFLQGSAYYPWVSWRTPFVDLVAYVPVSYAAVALGTTGTRFAVARTEATQRTLVVLGVGLALLLLLVTGAYNPLGSLKVELFTAIHLLPEFRSVYQRFMEYMPLVIAPLMAAGVETVATGLGRRLSPRSPLRTLGVGTAFAIAFLAIVLVPFPLWSGALYAGSGLLPSNRLSIPPAYLDMTAKLPPTSQAALLTLPIGTTNIAYLRWSGGASGFRGIQPLSFMTALPVIDQAPDGSRVRTVLIEGLAHRHLCSALEQLNVAFIAFESDADAAVMRAIGGYIGTPLDGTASTLRSAPCLVRADAAPGLVLYRDDQFVPRLVSFANALGGPSVPARYVVHPGDVVSVEAPSRPYRYLLLNEPNDGGWTLDGASPVSGHDITAFRLRRGRLLLIDGTTTEMRLLLGLALAMVVGTSAWIFLGRLSGLSRRSRRASQGVDRDRATETRT